MFQGTGMDKTISANLVQVCGVETVWVMLVEVSGKVWCTGSRVDIFAYRYSTLPFLHSDAF